jgi:hypothetical protein
LNAFSGSATEHCPDLLGGVEQNFHVARINALEPLAVDQIEVSLQLQKRPP